MTDREITRSDKINSLQRVAAYRPIFTVLIVVVSTCAALFEAIGLSFLFPIIQISQQENQAVETGGNIMEIFVSIYGGFNLPVTLETLLFGAGLMIVTRYTLTFLSQWLATKLRMDYEGKMKEVAFSRALGTSTEYYDQKGSDDILNSVITETRFAGRVIGRIITFCREVLLAVMYLSIALFFGPVLTLFSVIVLGGLTYTIRYVINPGNVLGERVANANQRIQRNIQAGTQGIRDVKLFGLNDELLSKFQPNLENYAESNIKLKRNEELIGSTYDMMVALLLFFLIYIAVDILSISLATLGVLLFAMFRLAPRVSNLNSRFYSIEGDLPHLVRTHAFIDELAHNQEQSNDESPPDVVETICFNDVTFSYSNSDETVLDGITFDVGREEFVAFVGQSGVGKSTIASLLTRMYDPDTGEILVNGTPIDEFDLQEWRSKFGVVRQNPHIFNESLEFNLTIGNRDATREEIAKAVDTAKVSEFLEDLPKGYDTELGEDGVQLSGGQRQRVALARALLTDADILVLDEATSDLDSNLEREIHDAIENLRSEYTLFVIAHRLSTVKNADRIYTLESGEITEAGTHDELIDNGGKYSELYATQ